MIDRNVPRKFVADKDERLLKVGDMIEAQNITITQRGEGSGSIVKTMKGTSVRQFVADSGTGLEASVTVIGKVEDPQTNKIYFFVASDSGNDNDMIVQYDPEYSTSGGYRQVFRSTWLNFDPTGFVKANVVNKAFQRDGVVQTVIYFTDNDNPPRKINVDRALAGDYSGLSSSDLDIALGAMRAAPTEPPLFTFDTDSTVEENNFEQNQFQFATQIVYVDGEVSALSPYSKLAISQASVFGGLEDTDYGVARNTQNVCVIKTNVSQNHPDISKVRLLARNGNSGGFFVVDEFDPSSNLTRYIAGGSKVVYDSNSEEYTFYNDSFGRAISDTESQKLYDNVPQKAEGQAVIGSRLMYSNYTEGYPNHSIPSSVEVDPVYATSIDGAESFITSGDIASIFSHAAGNLNVQLDLENGSLLGPSTAIPAGSVCIISFTFAPDFAATVASGNLMDIPVTQDDRDDPTYTAQEGSLRVTSATFDDLQTANRTVQVITRLPEDKTPSQLADFIHLTLDEVGPISLDYNLTSLSATGFNVDNTTINSCTAKVFFKFGEDTTASGDTIVFKPRITRIKLTDLVIAAVGPSEFFPGDTSDVFDKPGNAQSEVTYSSITDPASNDFISIDSVGATASFKSGANHAFGIVYYDKYGRSGFVNEIGSAHVQSIPERSSTPGSVAMRFNLSSPSFNAPSWAESYQIVYSGSSVSNVFQYTVGGAYYRRLTTDTAGFYDRDDSTHNIYVSLKTLDQYRRDKDVNLNYSFTKGDKLRIISHANSTDTARVYNPLSTEGNVMEFDVVGVETIESAPIRNTTTAETIDDRNPHDGTFLVLSAPAVEGTAGNAGAVEKYVGFDWYQITGEDYNPTDTVSAIDNRWNRDVLVEIITPGKSTSEKVYYEIGERRKCGVYKDASVGQHGPSFVVKGGDVYYRPRACKTPVYDSGWSTNNGENPENWIYRTKYLEDEGLNDLYDSENWDRGRVHSVFQEAATVNRYNGITYSEAYADDTAVLKLSSFTPSLANFFDLPSEKGRCSYIESFLDDLICFQETKCSLVKVNKDVIQTGSQAGLVSLSTSVLNNTTPFGGDFGTQNPESVLIRDGVGYAVDKRRAAIFRLSLQGLNPISDTDIKSFVESRFSTWSSNSGAKIVSGYDQEDDIYYVTLIADSDSNSTTLGWDESGSFWQGQYTFYPDIYASLGDKFFGAKYKQIGGNDDAIIHEFTDVNTNSNQFFGEGSAESKVTVVSNYNPSMVKQYNSISLEGDSAWTTTLESSTGQTTANLVFDEKEDAFYANVTGDTSSNSTNQYIPVGTVASVDGNVITMTNNLRGIHIPVGYSIFKNNAGTAYTQIIGSPTVSSVDRPNSKVTVSSGVNINPNDKLFVANTGGITGDQIRGHYCKIKCSLTPTLTAKEELYSINANFVNSKANHALGQQ